MWADFGTGTARRGPGQLLTSLRGVVPSRSRGRQVPWLLVITGLVVVGALTLAWETVRINNSTADYPNPWIYCSPESEWAEAGRLAFDAAALPWTLLLLQAAVALVVLVWGKTRLGPRRNATENMLIAVIVGLWGAVLMFNPMLMWFAQDYGRGSYCSTVSASSPALGPPRLAGSWTSHGFASTDSRNGSECRSIGLAAAPVAKGAVRSDGQGQKWRGHNAACGRSGRRGLGGHHAQKGRGSYG